VLIAHATDLAQPVDTAFEHALALASASGATLASVHATDGLARRDFPDASRTLARWGSSARVEQRCISHYCCDAVIDTLLDALNSLQPDLLVCATAARSGAAWLLAGSTAEGLARNLPGPTLLLPHDGKVFVNGKTGDIRLRRVLVAAGSEQDAQRGCDAAAALLAWAKQPAELLLLHVADGSAPPQPRLAPGLTCRRLTAQGGIDSAVIEAAAEWDVDCVVMASHGHDGAADVLLGSRTERVLHRTARPLLWVPVSAPA
jgi:nucleotide-binding universal stress UspA family protein